MPRPPSIRRFEQLYLGSLALWILAKVLFWPQAQALAANNPAFAAHPQLAAMVGAMLVGTTVVFGLVSLLFWWLVARRASVVGKWLVVVTEALGALSLLGTVLRAASGTVPLRADLVLNVVVTVLAIAAAATLFRADAERWFRAADGADTLR